MNILPSTYLPSIGYIAHIIESPSGCTIDLGEHFIKRSARNRTRIATSQGVMELSVPVCHANKPRQAINTITIDNSKRWQHQHWNTLLAAYKSSPYFDHYAPYLEPIYQKEWIYLVDLNNALLEVILKLLKLDKELSISTSQLYIEAQEGDVDLRPKGAVEQRFEPKQYHQVFADRLPFEPNLSVLDLLFCEGTTALDYVGVIRK